MSFEEKIAKSLFENSSKRDEMKAKLRIKIGAAIQDSKDLYKEITGEDYDVNARHS